MGTWVVLLIAVCDKVLLNGVRRGISFCDHFQSHFSRQSERSTLAVRFSTCADM